MPKVTPVDYDPFAAQPQATYKTTPVDYDPFAGQEQSLSNSRDEMIKKIRANARDPKQYAAGINSIARGVLDAPVGIAQLVPHAISYATSLGGYAPNAVSRGYARNAETVDKTVNKLEDNYKIQQQLMGQNPEDFDTGRLVGNIINPINYIGGGSAPTVAGGGGGMIKNAISATGTGAAYGAAQPVTGDGDYATKKLNQVKYGATAGLAGNALGGTVSRALNPKNPSKSVQTLLDEGVILTPGEILGGGFKKFEDTLSSVPILGSMQNAAKQKSLESFNKATINRALRTVGEKLPKDVQVGHGAVAYLEQNLGSKYDKLLPKLQGKMDKKFSESLDELVNNVNADHLMDAPDKQRFLDIVKTNVLPVFGKSGTATGASIKKSQQEIRRLAEGFSSSSLPSERQLGQVLKEYQDSFRKMLIRTNKGHAAELGRIDNAYSQFKRVQNASSSSASTNGIFSPTQYNQAVRAADRSKDKAAFARGKAFGQDLSNAAKEVLPASVGNSGTADRILNAGLAGSILSGGATVINPLFAAGAAAAGLYTKPGLRIAQAALTQRPHSVRALGDIASMLTRGSIPGLAVAAAKGANQ